MKKLLLLSFVLVAVSLLLTPVSDSVASGLRIPKVLSYQAFLVDENEAPLDRQVPVTFKIFDGETGGSPLWVEIQDVVADKGFANVYLGTINPINLPFDDQYWLEITVGNSTPFPRTRFSVAPYSMFAITADTADLALAVVEKGVTQEMLADGVMAIPMGPAGGALTGDYPNPGINPDAILDAIDDGSITQDKLAPNVTTPPSGPAGGDLTGTYPDPLIAVGAVKTDRIANGAVTTQKIADYAVTNMKIGPDAVTTDKIMNETILAEDIATGAVTTDEILDLTILNEDISDGAIDTRTILDMTILTEDIADRQITTEKIVEEAVTPFELEATAVTAGTYGDMYNVGSFTVDEDGRLVFAEDVLIQAMDDQLNSDIEVVGTDIDALDLQLYPDVVGVPEIYARTEDGEAVDKPGLGYNGTFLYYNYKAGNEEELTWSFAAEDQMSPVWDAATGQFYWGVPEVSTLDPIKGRGSVADPIKIDDHADFVGTYNSVLYFDQGTGSWEAHLLEPNNFNATPLEPTANEDGYVLTWDNTADQMRWEVPYALVETDHPVVGDGSPEDPVTLYTEGVGANDVLYFDGQMWTNGKIMNPMIADEQVDSRTIEDGTIQTIDVGDDQITYAKLQNADGLDGVMLKWDGTDWIEVRLNDIEDSDIDFNVDMPEALDLQIKANAVGETEIANNAVTLDKMADNSVGGDELINTAVTAGDYGTETAVGQFTVNEDGRLTFAQNVNIMVNDVPASDIDISGNTSSSLTLNIRPSTVGTDELINGGVMTADIGDRQVTYEKFQDADGADGVILNWDAVAQVWEEVRINDAAASDIDVAGDIADNLDLQLKAGTVDTDVLADDAVTLDKMADNSVDTDQLVDGAVTEDKIEDGAVTPEKFEAGTTNGQIFWWDATPGNEGWTTSTGAAPAETQVVKWVDNAGSLEPQWADDALTLPYMDSDASGATDLFDLSKTDAGAAVMVLEHEAAGDGLMVTVPSDNLSAGSAITATGGGAGEPTVDIVRNVDYDSHAGALRVDADYATLEDESYGAIIDLDVTTDDGYRSHGLYVNNTVTGATDGTRHSGIFAEASADDGYVGAVKGSAQGTSDLNIGVIGNADEATQNVGVFGVANTSGHGTSFGAIPAASAVGVMAFNNGGTADDYGVYSNAAGEGYGVYTMSGTGAALYATSATDDPEEYVGYVVNTSETENRSLYVEGYNTNTWGIEAGGPPYAYDEEAVLVVNNTSNNGAAIVTYGDIWANSSIGGSVLIGIDEVIVGDPAGLHVSLTPPVAPGAPMEIDDDVHIHGDLTVDDNTDLDGDLDLAGDADFHGTFDVDGNATFGGTAAVTGIASSEATNAEITTFGDDALTTVDWVNAAIAAIFPLPALEDGFGIVDFTYDGTATATVAVDVTDNYDFTGDLQHNGNDVVDVTTTPTVVDDIDGSFNGGFAIQSDVIESGMIIDGEIVSADLDDALIFATVSDGTNTFDVTDGDPTLNIVDDGAGFVDVTATPGTNTVTVSAQINHDATLTGDGTAGDPLGVDETYDFTWDGNHTFNGTVDMYDDLTFPTEGIVIGPNANGAGVMGANFMNIVNIYDLGAGPFGEEFGVFGYSVFDGWVDVLDLLYAGNGVQIDDIGTGFAIEANGLVDVNGNLEVEDIASSEATNAEITTFGDDALTTVDWVNAAIAAIFPLPALEDGFGIQDFTYDGTATATVAVDVTDNYDFTGDLQHNGNDVVDVTTTPTVVNDIDGSFDLGFTIQGDAVVSSMIDDGTIVSADLDDALIFATVSDGTNTFDVTDGDPTLNIVDDGAGFVDVTATPGTNTVTVSAQINHDATLTGDGTAGDPLGVDETYDFTWDGNHTFNGTVDMYNDLSFPTEGIDIGPNANGAGVMGANFMNIVNIYDLGAGPFGEEFSVAGYSVFDGWVDVLDFMYAGNGIQIDDIGTGFAIEANGLVDVNGNLEVEDIASSEATNAEITTFGDDALTTVDWVNAAIAAIFPLPALEDGFGIQDFTYDGTATATVAVDVTDNYDFTGDLQHNGNDVVDVTTTPTVVNDVDGSFDLGFTIQGDAVVSSMIDDGTIVSGDVADAFEFANISADAGAAISLTDGSHAMTIAGGTNITTTNSGNTLTIDAEVVTDFPIVGTGTSADPIDLQYDASLTEIANFLSLNMNNANTWVAHQTFATLESTGLATLATVDIDGGDIDGTTIDGATINSSTVGLTTPAAGKFTNLNVTGVLQVEAGGGLDVDDQANFAINDNATAVAISNPHAGVDARSLFIASGEAEFDDDVDFDGNMVYVENTLQVETGGTLDVNGTGDFDGAVDIEYNNASPALTVHNNNGYAILVDGNMHLQSQITFDVPNIVIGDDALANGNDGIEVGSIQIDEQTDDIYGIATLTAADGSFTNSLTVDGNATFDGTTTIATADINGGNIDGTAIGSATPSTGAFTTGSFEASVANGGSDNAVLYVTNNNGAADDVAIKTDGDIVIGSSLVATDGTTEKARVNGTTGAITGESGTFTNDLWSNGYEVLTTNTGVTYTGSGTFTTTQTMIPTVGDSPAIIATNDSPSGGSATIEVTNASGDGTAINVKQGNLVVHGTIIAEPEYDDPVDAVEAMIAKGNTDVDRMSISTALYMQNGKIRYSYYQVDDAALIDLDDYGWATILEIVDVNGSGNVYLPDHWDHIGQMLYIVNPTGGEGAITLEDPIDSDTFTVADGETAVFIVVDDGGAGNWYKLSL